MGACCSSNASTGSTVDHSEKTDVFDTLDQEENKAWDDYWAGVLPTEALITTIDDTCWSGWFENERNTSEKRELFIENIKSDSNGILTASGGKNVKTWSLTGKILPDKVQFTITSNNEIREYNGSFKSDADGSLIEGNWVQRTEKQVPNFSIEYKEFVTGEKKDFIGKYVAKTDMGDCNGYHVYTKVSTGHLVFYAKANDAWILAGPSDSSALLQQAKANPSKSFANMGLARFEWVWKGWSNGRELAGKALSENFEIIPHNPWDQGQKQAGRFMLRRSGWKGVIKQKNTQRKMALWYMTTVGSQITAYGLQDQEGMFSMQGQSDQDGKVVFTQRFEDRKDIVIRYSVQSENKKTGELIAFDWQDVLADAVERLVGAETSPWPKDCVYCEDRRGQPLKLVWDQNNRASVVIPDSFKAKHPKGEYPEPINFPLRISHAGRTTREYVGKYQKANAQNKFTTISGCCSNPKNTDILEGCQFVLYKNELALKVINSEKQFETYISRQNTLPDGETFYSLLGIDEENLNNNDPVDEKILANGAKDAWKKWHPDKHMQKGEDKLAVATAMCQMIRIAVETFKSRETKTAYNEFLKAKRGINVVRFPPPNDPAEYWGTGQAFRWALNVGMIAVGVAAIAVSVLAAPATLGSSFALTAGGGGLLSAGVAGCFKTAEEKKGQTEAERWSNWGIASGVGFATGAIGGGVGCLAGAKVQVAVEAGKWGSKGALAFMAGTSAGAGVVNQAIEDCAAVAEGTKTSDDLSIQNYGKAAIVGFVAGAAGKYLGDRAQKIGEKADDLADIGPVEKAVEVAPDIFTVQKKAVKFSVSRGRVSTDAADVSQRASIQVGDAAEMSGRVKLLRSTATFLAEPTSEMTAGTAGTVYDAIMSGDDWQQKFEENFKADGFVKRNKGTVAKVLEGIAKAGG